LEKKIKFVDTTGNIDKIYYPKPAKNSMPQWFLNLEAYKNGKVSFEANANSGTAKRCLPMMDAMGSGYILFSPTDIYVTFENGAHAFQWPSGNGIEFHGNYQTAGHKKSSKFSATPKFAMDWAVWTPPGYSCLYTPPLNRDDSILEIFSAVVDTDKFHIPGSLPFLFCDPEFSGLIPAGTPIAQVIPFKREKYKMVIGDEADVKESRDQFAKLKSVFMNGYRKFFWSPKSYK